MNEWRTSVKFIGVAFVASLVGCSNMGSIGSMGSSAYDMLGGTSGVTKLAGGLVDSAMKDPRLSALTAGKSGSTAATTTKMSDQLCALLGGGCKAPLSDSQLSAAASKLSPDQSKALSENFTTALNGVTSNPAVRDTVTKTLGSKLGGLGGLL
jgi:hypothetical protein